MAIALRDVLEDPAAAARVLEETLPGCVALRATRIRDAVILNLEFGPLPELPDYPAERVRIRIYLDGQVEAVPVGPRREWKHRNPSPYGASYMDLNGALCLYYPHDPAPLTWTWADGLESFVMRARRHLIFEEAWRRHGQWPAEDAPHGEPEHGAHPILSRFVKQEVKRWNRLS